MKWKLLTLAMLLAWTPLVRAADETLPLYPGQQIISPLNWNTDPAHWDMLIQKQSTTLRIGKSDYSVSGPLIEGVRKQRHSSDRSLGQKILGLPIVHLFVPQPMPYPPGSGKYFRWGESARPWSAIAAAGGGAGADIAVSHEPQMTLISISR